MHRGRDQNLGRIVRDHHLHNEFNHQSHVSLSTSLLPTQRSTDQEFALRDGRIELVQRDHAVAGNEQQRACHARSTNEQPQTTSYNAKRLVSHPRRQSAARRAARRSRADPDAPPLASPSC